MTRRLTIVLFLLLCAVGAMRLSAHDEFRIIGTLEKHQDSKIAVKKTRARPCRSESTSRRPSRRTTRKWTRQR